MDNFGRADGSVGNGWIGSSWQIKNGKVIYSPTLIQKVTNPGAEGIYTNGLAPNWWVVVDNGAKSEENVTIHDGTSAEHINGSGREFICAETANTTNGKSYYAKQWVNVISGTQVYPKLRYGRGDLVSGYGTAIAGVGYKLYETIFTNNNAYPAVSPCLDTTSAADAYADDFSLYEFDPAGRFLVRNYASSDVVVSAIMSYSGTTAVKYVNNVGVGYPAVIASLDNPANPQNYVAAYYDGCLKLDKIVSGVKTNLINANCGDAPNNDFLEIRKNGSTYQLFSHGKQIGVSQTISDPAILAGTYVGLSGAENDTATSFGTFIVRPYGVNLPSTKSNFVAPAPISPDKGVISLRFDDSYYKDYSIVFPLLTARNLTGGFAVIRNMIGSTNYLSLDQIKTMQASGLEIMSHSYSHASDPTSITNFNYEISESVEEMRLLGININTFVQPGTWLGVYYTSMHSTKFFGTPEDALLRQYYSAWEGYLWGTDRTLPITGNYRYGANHLTCDKMPLADFKALVDWTIDNKKGREILFHPQNFGKTSYISVADFTSFLDYLQTKVAAGQLVVLTPTQQLYATVSTALLGTPTNFSAISNSNSATLTVDKFQNDTSGQSGYYFSRSSGGNSGWIQTNSWTDASLACGHEYTYSVKYRNSEGVETSAISIKKSTSNCITSGGSSSGGGGGSTSTNNQTTSTATDPSTSTLAGSDLSLGPQGKIIKVIGNNRPAIYYVIDGKKYLFVNRVTYTSWSTTIGDMGNRFATLQNISQTEFDDLPIGGNLIAKPGYLIVFDDSPITYAVGTGGKLYKFADATAQTAFYGSIVPYTIQAGFREGYYNHGNPVATLTASSSKPY